MLQRIQGNFLEGLRNATEQAQSGRLAGSKREVCNVVLSALHYSVLALVQRHSPLTTWPLLVNTKDWDRGLSRFCTQSRLKIALTVRGEVGKRRVWDLQHT